MSRHGERIAELVEVESAKRNDRPQLGAVMAFAKKRKATLPRSPIGSFIHLDGDLVFLANRDVPAILRRDGHIWLDQSRNWPRAPSGG